MEEIEYADLEWAKECEVGEITSKPIGGKLFDIISINDLDDQLLRESCTKNDAAGIPDFDDVEYKIQLLLKVVVKPKLTREMINLIRLNKKSGIYGQLVREAMDVSGIGMGLIEIEKEKNSEGPTESSA